MFLIAGGRERRFDRRRDCKARRLVAESVLAGSVIRRRCSVNEQRRRQVSLPALCLVSYLSRRLWRVLEPDGRL